MGQMITPKIRQKYLRDQHSQLYIAKNVRTIKTFQGKNSGKPAGH